MKRFFSLLLALGLVFGLRPAGAQVPGKYLTKMGRVTFFSATPIEDIEARNDQVAAVLDLASGQVAFSLPVTGFVFKRTLMQEHFNENYLESDKYPRATFSGRFVGLDAAGLAGPGPHGAVVEGTLTMHGVARRVRVPATLELRGGLLLAQATFVVASADYNIEIPLLVRDKIDKEISVRVALSCAPVPGALGLVPKPPN